MRFIFVLVLIILPCLSATAQWINFQDVNFDKADSIAKHYADYSLKDHEELAILLTKDLSTDVEKFRAIFKWITENISYDIPSYIEYVRMEKKLRYKKKRLARWRGKFHNTITRRIIQKKTAICYGYASLLTTMCNSAGIPCTIVDGYARDQTSSIGSGSVNHAWNAVKLKDRWFLCDPTWASGTVDMKQKQFFREFNKVYFLTPPELLVANHYPADTSWTLLKNGPSKKEFMNAPIKL
ncbi:MAG TPA: transglutaminase domain-containing protein, partial [Chryseolinea sp.]